jgi:hypothetical protein
MPEDQEEDEPFPIPEESNEPIATAPPAEWNSMEWMQERLTRWMKYATEQNAWESWRRPDWWSPAWEALGEVRDDNGQRLHPGSPLALKESIT